MANPNSTIGTIQADDRGFVTRKQCRGQIREALKAIGLSCGLMQSEGGKRYIATITNSKVTVTAERKAGAKIVAQATKKALKALAVERQVTEIIENDPLGVLDTADEPEIVVVPKPKKAKKSKAKAKSLLTVEDFGVLSMDEQGRLTSVHPREGGLSAGAIRAMLTAHNPEFADIPTSFKKADMVELLLLVAAESAETATIHSNVLPFVDDLGVDDLQF